MRVREGRGVEAGEVGEVEVEVGVREVHQVGPPPPPPWSTSTTPLATHVSHAPLPLPPRYPKPHSTSSACMGTTAAITPCAEGIAAAGAPASPTARRAFASTPAPSPPLCRRQRRQRGHIPHDGHGEQHIAARHRKRFRFPPSPASHWPPLSRARAAAVGQNAPDVVLYSHLHHRLTRLNLQGLRLAVGGNESDLRHQGASSSSTNKIAASGQRRAPRRACSCKCAGTVAPLEQQ